MKAIWDCEAAEGLFSQILALRSKATGDANHRDNLVEVEHNDLTIIFHDSITVGDVNGDNPPLAVVLSDRGVRVFMGNVDPEDVRVNLVVEWERGEWERHLGQAH